MSNTHHISAHGHIKNNSVTLNGEVLFKSSDQEFSSFIRSAAKHFEINYPKFYKMDRLSKLAFLAADVLLMDNKSKSAPENNIAIVLSNRTSSLDTDQKHQQTINAREHFFPSPSIFVYTLPNICIGEISIKHQLHSENCFFIFEDFNADHLYVNAEYLLNAQKAQKVLCGWVDIEENNYEAFLYIVEENGNFTHCPKEIKRLYTS